MTLCSISMIHYFSTLWLILEVLLILELVRHHLFKLFLLTLIQIDEWVNHQIFQAYINRAYVFGKMEMFREAVADYTTVSLLPLLIPISYFIYVFHGIIVVALFSMSVSTCQSVFPSTSQDSLSLSLSLYLSLSQTHTFSFSSPLSFSMYLTIYHYRLR